MALLTGRKAAACDDEPQLPDVFSNPTNAVGGSFILNLKVRCKIVGYVVFQFRRLNMNHPPTALVGLGGRSFAGSVCRLCMNYPPTTLVGFRNFHSRSWGIFAFHRV